MEVKRHRTRIDWWIAIILAITGIAVPFVLILGIALQWYADNLENIIVGITAGFTFFIVIAAFLLSYFAVYYKLDESELIVRNTFFSTKRVSYDNILSVKESVNIINRPKTWAAPLSVVGIQVDYLKENGEKSWFFIAPKNRNEFIKLLQGKINNQ